MYQFNAKHKLIGHRGVAGLRPENTLASFSHAAKIGIDWVEFDVQLTKDHQWIVMHDETIDRTTTGIGKPCNYTLAELTKIQAGLWFNPPYPDQYIPSLQEVINLCNSLGLNMNIEVKGSSPDPEMHAELILKTLEKNHSKNRAILVSNFDTECIQLIRKLERRIPIGYLIEEFHADSVLIAREYEFNSINCDVNKITIENVRQATDNKLPVLLYTINDKITADSWLNNGVSGVFSDRPDLLLD